ncbi:hypothetical protein ACFX10_000992 [Malus domestica]
MFQTILRRAVGSVGPRPDPWRLTATMNYSTSKDTMAKKAKKTGKSKNDPSATAGDDVSETDADLPGGNSHARQLQVDEKDPSLDVGPNGRPLFTSTPTLSQLSRKDTCSYFKLKTWHLFIGLICPPVKYCWSLVQLEELALRPYRLARLWEPLLSL